MRSILFLLIFSFLYSNFTFALPLYTARSGRTCNNCHSSPKEWKNPVLSERKCTLSCSSCHVDPTGGGLRNVSGNFYARATLPFQSPFYTPNEHHNGDYSIKIKDKKEREALRLALEMKKTNAIEPNPNPNYHSLELAFSKPIIGKSKMAFDDDRYNGLNADPLVRLGVDARLAYWSESGVFPMQLDTQMAFHPFAYTQLYVNGGFLNRYDGIDKGEIPNYRIKDIFVLIDQLPYMSYIKVGHFIPPFGTRLDDHTSYIRKEFELNQDIINSRVTGVEIGTSPNYPYLNLAYFKPKHKDSVFTSHLDSEANDLNSGEGHGVAATTGYRDVAAGIGGSYMMRRRSLDYGGNTNSYSLSWYFNPWFLDKNLPLTYMGEVAFGDYQRFVSGNVAKQLALYQEFDYRFNKLINLKFNYDFNDPDKAVKEDEEHRLSFGLDVNFITGLTATGWARISRKNKTGAESLPDLIVYLHGFY